MSNSNSRYDEKLAFMLRYENIAWYENGEVKILDRRIYPTEIKFVVCKSYVEVSQAITDMVTQSAGPYTAAGMGMALAAYESQSMSADEKIDFLTKASYKIYNSRPTTANRMKLITEGCLKEQIEAIKSNKSPIEAAFNRTIESLERRYSTISKVAKSLVDLFPQKANVMTQCFGETIVGFMAKEVVERGYDIKFFCPETRPYLQGSRLTASVLNDMGLDVTVITDNMPAWVMKKFKIDVFTSAADTICMDGTVVNKVGTLQIASLAKLNSIPYFVTGIPDLDKLDESYVTIEERDPEEVLSFRGTKVTMKGVKAYYPSFDITPAHLVSAVVTDKGIFAPNDLKSYLDSAISEYY